MFLEHRRAKALSSGQQPQEQLGGWHGKGEGWELLGVRLWDLPGQCQDVVVTLPRSF